MTRGIDTITPGSRVRVTSDILAGDPANSELIGREGVIGNEDAGVDVTVTFDGDPTAYRFNPSELQVLAAATDCPHGYRPTDSCPCC